MNSPASLEWGVAKSVPSAENLRRTLATLDWRGFVQGRGAGNTPFAALAAAGAGVVGAGTLELGVNDSQGVIWNATADQTDEAAIPFVLPDDFNPQRDEVCVEVRVRKRDTTGSAAENATLRLDGVFEHFKPGDAAIVQETAIQNLLPAKTAATSFASFTTLRYQLRGRSLVPKSSCLLRLAPQAAVGTALAVEILSATVNIGHNLQFADQAERSRLWATGNGT